MPDSRLLVPSPIAEEPRLDPRTDERRLQSVDFDSVPMFTTALITFGVRGAPKRRNLARYQTVGVGRSASGPRAYRQI